MNVRIEQKEQTRRKIVRAANVLFSKQGFVRVNTAAVAAKAGVSHGSIFAHFESRDELIAAVIEEFERSTARHMHELAESQASLRAILAAHLECIRQNELFYSQLIREYSSLPHQAQMEVVALQSVISHHVYLAAEIEVREKSIKPIAPDLLFNTWLALVNYYLANRDLFATHGSVIDENGKKLLDHFLDLVSL
jgi:AcrR family transcriptional regulator